MTDVTEGPPRVVRGTVVLPGDAPIPDSATVRVLVEDVSRADAPSLVIREWRNAETQLKARAELPFVVEVPASRIDPRHSYAVRVHVDVSGTGVVRPGDFVSTQAHPVLTRGHGDVARVPVRRV